MYLLLFFLKTKRKETKNISNTSLLNHIIRDRSVFKCISNSLLGQISTKSTKMQREGSRKEREKEKGKGRKEKKRNKKEKRKRDKKEKSKNERKR